MYRTTRCHNYQQIRRIKWKCTNNYKPNNYKPNENQTIRNQRVNPRTEPDRPCYRCGGKHFANNCVYRTTRCHNCQQIRRIKWKCTNNYKPKRRGRAHSSNYRSKQTQHMVAEDSDNGNDDQTQLKRKGESRYGMYRLNSSKSSSDPLFFES
ncbi:hypothetical protein SNE40_009649 [Patella caerulea]|uniref:Uncharacterized protein n=1 Tax=Patella caerulea TaxID=87958 RepID=A0AAN8PYS5_PATCE